MHFKQWCILKWRWCWCWHLKCEMIFSCTVELLDALDHQSSDPANLCRGCSSFQLSTARLYKLVFVLMADQTVLRSTPGWLLLFCFSPIINTLTFYSALQHCGVATWVFCCAQLQLQWSKMYLVSFQIIFLILVSCSYFYCSLGIWGGSLIAIANQ